MKQGHEVPLLAKVIYKGPVIIYVEGGREKRRGGSSLFQIDKREGLNFLLEKFREGQQFDHEVYIKRSLLARMGKAVK